MFKRNGKNILLSVCSFISANVICLFFRFRCVLIRSNQKCIVCEGRLLAQAFYMFPCHHSFHHDCLVGEMDKIQKARQRSASLQVLVTQLLAIIVHCLHAYMYTAYMHTAYMHTVHCLHVHVHCLHAYMYTIHAQLFCFVYYVVTPLFVFLQIKC